MPTEKTTNTTRAARNVSKCDTPDWLKKRGDLSFSAHFFLGQYLDAGHTDNFHTSKVLFHRNTRKVNDDSTNKNRKRRRPAQKKKKNSGWPSHYDSSGYIDGRRAVCIGARDTVAVCN